MKLRAQALPIFIVLTLLTKEINGFTLPHPPKENKESLTDAMVINFVTFVFFYKGTVTTLGDSVCFLFSVGSGDDDLLRKSIKVEFRKSKELDFFPISQNPTKC